MKKYLLLGCIAFLCACQSNPEQEEERVYDMDVRLQHASGWNGKQIPGGQICPKDGGNGESPPLVVYGIPKGTNAVLVEFNDLDNLALSVDGGMGIVGYPYAEDGSETAVLQPVPTGDILPSYAFKERNHRYPAGLRGAYMAPCGRGAGHRYQATVKAVKREGALDTQTTKVLGIGYVELGTY